MVIQEVRAMEFVLFCDIGNTHIRLYLVKKNTGQIVIYQKYSFSVPRNVNGSSLGEIDNIFGKFIKKIKTYKLHCSVTDTIIGYADFIDLITKNYFVKLVSRHLTSRLHLLNDVELSSYMLEEDNDFLFLKIGSSIGVSGKLHKEIFRSEGGSIELYINPQNKTLSQYFHFLRNQIGIKYPRFYHILSSKGVMYLHAFFSKRCGRNIPKSQNCWNTKYVDRSIKEILKEPVARKILEVYSESLFSFIKILCLAFLPKVVFLGGPLIESKKEIFESHLTEMLKNNTVKKRYFDTLKITFIPVRFNKYSFQTFFNHYPPLV